LGASLEQLVGVLSSIVAAIDWKVAVPAIIAALAGLIGAWLGARGAVRARVKKHRAEVDYARRSLAAALRGELLAYFEIVERREQLRQAELALADLKAGEPVDLPLSGRARRAICRPRVGK